MSGKGIRYSRQTDSPIVRGGVQWDPPTYSLPTLVIVRKGR
jgi:hypothetical protein